MTIDRAWSIYVKKLSEIDVNASEKIANYISKIDGFSFDDPKKMEALIEYAYGISTKYGEGAAALACEMYDAVALASDIYIDPAEPAETASFGEVAKAINGSSKTKNPKIVSSAVGRLVKRTGADTTLKNGIRDGAEFAWIPNGDTCAFCITLASRGWQRASKSLMKSGHAQHIHANCDCTYAVRFNENTTYKGYDPAKYEDMYYDAPLREGETESAKNRVNALRREFYKKNKEKINSQKRIAYKSRKELLNSSAAEEINVNNIN